MCDWTTCDECIGGVKAGCGTWNFPRLFVEEKRLTGFPACSDVVVFCAVMSTFYFPRSDKHDGKAGSVCVGYA